MITDDELEHVTAACQALPPAKGNYLIDDYVTNLMLTVLDFQMQTVAVERAHHFYEQNRWSELRTYHDLCGLFERFTDDKQGNTEVALYCWNYKLWTRAGYLRHLTSYFGTISVTNQEALRTWAHASTYDRDFQGRVRGLGPTVYNWLIMRQGIETVKPDVHVLRFMNGLVERSITPKEAVTALESVAKRLGLKAYELDWRIWESQRDSAQV